MRRVLGYQMAIRASKIWHLRGVPPQSPHTLAEQLFSHFANKETEAQSI